MRRAVLLVASVGGLPAACRATGEPPSQFEAMRAAKPGGRAHRTADDAATIVLE